MQFFTNSTISPHKKIVPIFKKKVKKTIILFEIDD